MHDIQRRIQVALCDLLQRPMVHTPNRKREGEKKEEDAIQLLHTSGCLPVATASKHKQAKDTDVKSVILLDRLHVRVWSACVDQWCDDGTVRERGPEV